MVVCREVELKVLEILAHTAGKSTAEIHVAIDDPRLPMLTFGKECLYQMKDWGLVTQSKGLWELSVGGYARLNLLRAPLTPEPVLTKATVPAFTRNDSYSGEDLRELVGRAGAFDYRSKPSREGDRLVDYRVARSMNCQ